MMVPVENLLINPCLRKDLSFKTILEKTSFKALTVLAKNSFNKFLLKAVMVFVKSYLKSVLVKNSIKKITS